MATHEEQFREQQRIMAVQAGISQRASTMYSAHMELFNVAAMTSDQAEMQVQRDKLHALLDSLLDSSALVLIAQEQLAVISREWSARR